jgi:iron complex transport system permease protein
LSQYQHIKHRQIKRISAAFILLALGVILSYTALLYPLQWPLDETQEMIITQIRLPRLLGALLCGAALGLSGALMQGALRNPLASPFTLGVSQAAAFGASFAIIILGAYEGANGIYSVTLCAFTSALFGMGIVIVLGRSIAFRPEVLVLGGVAIGALFGASTMLLQYFASDLDAAATLFWTFGDLGKAMWHHIGILLGILATSAAVLWRIHWQVDALLLGDAHAHALGVCPSRLRLWLLLMATLLGSLAVAYFGVIGFIGLIAPHLIRLLLGSSHAAVLPLSALGGGVLLLGADVAAQHLMAQSILPVGILTAFLGAPLFLYLLIRQGRTWR